MSITSVALSPVYEDYWNFPGRISGRYGGPWSDDSILIFLTVGGSVIPMRVLESDSIASVKLRIQKCNGFSSKNQKLVFHGKELARSNSRVRDYGMIDGNLLHLVMPLCDIQAITVRTVCGKEYVFKLPKTKNVGYVKQQIVRRGEGLIDLKDHELFCNDEKLEDQRIVGDICKSNGAVIHLLVRKSVKLRAIPVEKDFEVSIIASDVGKKVAKAQNMKLPLVKVDSTRKDFLMEPLTVNPEIVLSPLIRKLIDTTFDGLDKGYHPVMSTDGSGGVYFMQDSLGQNYVSVFKPVDEEPSAVNNPRGLPLSSDGEGLKKGTRVGEGAIREVAAYILDHPIGGHEKGFAGVPPTIMVKCQHRAFNGESEKFGSLQMFVKNDGSCEDMGPRDFPVEEVHKICVLDMRLVNADRHAGNILICRDSDEGRIVLIPIDHGYCLPETFEDCTFEWLNWPQSRKPFSEDTIAYVNSLDSEKDIELLESSGWKVPDNIARIFHISTMLLKKGVERGLTPFAIGNIMCRERLDEESLIEKIVQQAEDAVLPGMSEDGFLECVSDLIDLHLDQL